MSFSAVHNADLQDALVDYVPPARQQPQTGPAGECSSSKRLVTMTLLGKAIWDIAIWPGFNGYTVVPFVELNSIE